MTAARGGKRDLRGQIKDPGFTPALRDAGAVAELLAEEASAEDAARALLKLAPLGEPAWTAIAKLVDDARAAVRAGVLDALTQLDAGKTVPLAVRALNDEEAAVRRRAIAALGRHASTEGESALLAAYGPSSAAHRRAIVLALGKSGDTASRDFFRTLARDPATADDAELTRLVQQARARLERDEVRQTPSRILGDRALEASLLPFALTYLTRRGLEPLLVEELASRGTSGARVVGEGRVTLPWRGTLDEALAAARTAYAVALPLPPVRIGEDGLEAAILRALTSPEAKARLAGLTDGPVRFRLSLAGKGHKRALVWKIAGALAANPDTSWLVNDAQQAPWEAHVTVDGADGDGEGEGEGEGRDDKGETGDADPTSGTLSIELRPRALVDDRFAYRADDVPASSHPPLAAALARVAGVRAEDVVWDPFAGAGTELVERARLGPYARLLGSDREESAIRAARANVRRAGVGTNGGPGRGAITLRVADVFDEPPPGVTVILTNPPMGRRVTGALDLSTLLDRFILQAAHVLAAKGSRLVWLSPQPKRTRTRAEAEGLTLSRALTVDMGGFDAELQRFDRL